MVLIFDTWILVVIFVMNIFRKGVFGEEYDNV